MRGIKRPLVALAVVVALSVGVTGATITTDAVTGTEHVAHAWPWDGKSLSYACAAGIGAFGLGTISAGPFIEGEGGNWLLLWSLTYLTDIAAMVSACREDLKSGRTAEQKVRRFCVYPRSWFVANKNEWFYTPRGWVYLKRAEFYRYECGGYTGYGYNGGPNASWPSPELVFGTLGS